MLIAAVGILAHRVDRREYAKRIQAAGALYDYVTDGLGAADRRRRRLALLPGHHGARRRPAVLIGGTIHDTLAAEFALTGVPITGWTLICWRCIAVIMYFGVALSTRAQLILALISIATVLVFSST